MVRVVLRAPDTKGAAGAPPLAGRRPTTRGYGSRPTVGQVAVHPPVRPNPPPRAPAVRDHFGRVRGRVGRDGSGPDPRPSTPARDALSLSAGGLVETPPSAAAPRHGTARTPTTRPAGRPTRRAGPRHEAIDIYPRHAPVLLPRSGNVRGRAIHATRSWNGASPHPPHSNPHCQRTLPPTRVSRMSSQPPPREGT